MGVVSLEYMLSTSLDCVGYYITLRSSTSAAPGHLLLQYFFRLCWMDTTLRYVVPPVQHQDTSYFSTSLDCVGWILHYVT